MTWREAMMWVHGVGLGSVFLLAFTVIAVGINSLRNEWITAEGIDFWLGKLKIGLWAVALIAWLTTLIGIFIIFPWYRINPPAGTSDLSQYPRYFLLANASLAQWNSFGMEWKEHVGLITPIASTVVAYVVQVYGAQLLKSTPIRRALLEFFSVAFVTGAIAGVFGVLITRAAPIY